MDHFDSASFPDTASGKPSRKPKKFLRVLQGGAAQDDGAENGLGRVPPHSIEAEQHLLSACLLDGAAVVAKCEAEKLLEGAFYVPANRVIYRILVDMYRRQAPIDLAVLAEELKTRGHLDEVGGYPYLTRISGRIPTTAGAGYFIEKVREMWLLREAIQRGKELVEACYGYTGPTVGGELMPKVVGLQRLIDFADRTTRGPASLLERMRKRMARTVALVHGEVDSSHCLTTGDAYTDSIFLPFDVEEEDWFCIVGGPPSGGKSAWMRWVALRNIRAGKFCVVFILETGMRWLEQAAAMMARVDLRKRAEWTEDMLRAYQVAFAEVEGYVADGRLHLFDDVFHVEDIESITRRIHRGLRDKQIAAGVPEAKARGLDLAVVDYLQLLKTRMNDHGRMMDEQVISTCGRTLKLMLKSINITGLVGAQVNRAGREDADKVPTLRDLRGSGSIEQDADRVFFVHTPPNNKAGMPQTGSVPIDEVEIHQRKSRNGPRDVCVGMLFEKKFTLYHPREDRPAARPGMPKPIGGYGRA